MKINNLEEQEVNDIIEKESIDLSSFQVKDNLNPKIFDREQHMHKDVRTRLLMIADDFFETLDIGWVEIDDIILTGSLANYNWSKFSDVDLHILVDFDEVDENVELVRSYFNSKKNLWNEKHNITVKGYDVELYLQDTEEPHIASGVYSVMWDKWNIKPEKQDFKIDSKKVRQKANSLIDSIKYFFELYKGGDYDKVIRSIKNIKQKIKKMRQSGLDRDGEYAYENITFKVLRRMEFLDKLSELETLAYDKSLTLDESIQFIKN
jgi:predicted nucleotidyltransferase